MSKLIMLAAGQGTRLRPLTDSVPKCLVELNGRSLLDWQLDTARRCGVEQVVVVAGYRADQIARPEVKIVLNANYASTNMVESLWCAGPELTGEVIVSYADILFTPKVLGSLLGGTEDIEVVVDLDWLPYWRRRMEDPMADAESLRMDQDGFLLELGQPPKSLDQIQAQYIGLIKFTARGLKWFRDHYGPRRDGLATDDRSHCPRAPRSWYMTDLLQSLIDNGHPVHAVPVHRGWLEIDSVEDYNLARQLMSFGSEGVTIKD